MMGAVVARRIELAGNAAFHYDEALAAEDDGMPYAVVRWRELDSAAEDDGMPYGVVRWRELDSAAERAVHEPKFAGW